METNEAELRRDLELSRKRASDLLREVNAARRREAMRGGGGGGDDASGAGRSAADADAVVAEMQRELEAEIAASEAAAAASAKREGASRRKLADVNTKLTEAEHALHETKIALMKSERRANDLSRDLEKETNKSARLELACAKGGLKLPK